MRGTLPRKERVQSVATGGERWRRIPAGFRTLSQKVTKIKHRNNHKL